MKRRTGLWILTATHAANDFYPGAIAALLPFFVLERGYDYAAAAGITLAATSLSSIAQPAFGYLCDRFRLRWLVIAGLGMASAGVAVSGLVSQTYWLTWIVIAISGIGVAAYHPAATVAARQAGGGSNGSMSMFAVGGNVGAALAPTAVILVVGTLGLGATPLLAAPAVAVAIPYLTRAWLAGRVSSRSALPTSDQPAGPPRMDDAWVLFAVLVGLVAFWSITYVGVSSFITLYSIERFQVDAAVASIALSVFPAAGAIGTLAGGWLADRYRRFAVIRCGYLAAACSMLLIVLAPSPAIVVIGSGALGIALFIPFAPQITLAHSYLPSRIGLASGVTLGLTLSLGGLASPALGALADATSIRTTMTLMTGLLVIALAASFLLRERTRPAAPEVAAPAATESS